MGDLVKHGGRRLTAGRPVTSVDGKRLVSLARDRGREQLAQAIKFWGDTLRSPTASWTEKHKAAQEICGRCGLPHQQQVDSTSVQTKLSGDEILRAFEVLSGDGEVS